MRAYQKNHRRRESFGNSGQVITQFDISGKKIDTYPSLSAAAKAIGVSSAALSDILRKEDGFGVGYIWRHGNKNAQLLQIPNSVKKMIEWKQLHNSVITQYDLAGKKIKEHLNILAAARSTNSQTHSITSVVLGKTHTSKGYYWKLGKGPTRIDILPILEKRLEKLRKSICRHVTQMKPGGKKINTYRSVAEAARAIGVTDMSIHSAIKRAKTCKGIPLGICR
ncbi:MAG TPA: NUMOD1 domain-containing DNA-binding protein [Chitinophagaceae bacterium]